MSLQFNGFTGTLDYVGAGVGGSISGGGTATQVAFFTAATAIGSDAGLFYLPVSGGGPQLAIGTTTPAARFHIAADTLSSGTIEVANDADAQTGRWDFRRARGTHALPTPVTAGKILGQLLWFGFDGAAPGPPILYGASTASIQGVADATFVPGSNYGGPARSLIEQM